MALKDHHLCCNSFALFCSDRAIFVQLLSCHIDLPGKDHKRKSSKLKLLQPLDRGSCGGVAPQEISGAPVDGDHATRTYKVMRVSIMDENTKKMHEVLKDRIERKYMEPPVDKNTSICIIGDPMQNPEEVLGRVRKAAAQTVFEDNVKTRQAHLCSINHPR